MGRRTKHIFWLVALCSLAVHISGCSTNPYTGRWQFLAIPEGYETSLGEQSYAQVLHDPKNKISTNPREVDPVRRVADRIIEVAKRSRFVHSLPDGYDTVIDEEGSNISAGEKQLITIARAFISQPSILILDEATSSVDTRTELLVQHATAVLRSDRTSFVIAHRLSTIRDADLIVVMEDGRIVEQGSHDDLLLTRGAYYRLYNSQFVSA